MYDLSALKKRNAAKDVGLKLSSKSVRRHDGHKKAVYYDQEHDETVIEFLIHSKGPMDRDIYVRR